MKILILNKNKFNALMISNHVTCDNIGSLKNLCVISINDTHGEMSKSYFEECDSPNVLKLYFDDTDGEEDGFAAFSKEQGEQVIEFLEQIDVTDNTQLILHCTAGQNRSGSIGKFAADYLGYDYKKLLRENPIIKGNSVVSRTLNNLYFH